MRRLVPGALGKRVAHELAQLLVVGLRVVGDELAERVVAFVEQALAPAFGAVQRGGFAARAVAVVGERGADRGERFVVEAAHPLGEELVLALARDVRGDGARAPHFVAQVVVERHLRQLRFAHAGQRFGELEHVERLAAALAAAGAEQLGVRVVKIGFVHQGFREQTVNSTAIDKDTSSADLDRLAQIARDVVALARAKGASASDVAASIDLGLAVGVRLGEVETVERTRDRGVSVTVYFGQRKGSATTADLDAKSIERTVEHACAIARYTEADPANGLADPALLAKTIPDLDLWHPWDITPEEAIRLGVEIEDAGRSFDARIGNSDGASVQVGASMTAYANSNGFVGTERGTSHSLSVALIAEDDNGMQRDYWYDAVRRAADFASAESIGRKAAQRTLARLGARRLSTRECPVLFTPEVARGLIGHFLSAASGGALYRQSSFLVDHVGKRVFPAWMQIVERPHIPRGHGSTAFDSEGVATRDSDLVEDGVLARYILGSYSARKLGLQSTGNAGGVQNILVQPGAEDRAPDDFSALLRRMGTGLLVTELMGQGVSLVTGDYSRGASGFWVENGAIAYPVEEITIAGNLRDMYANLVAVGSDVDPRSHILTGSILLERMTVAGE